MNLKDLPKLSPRSTRGLTGIEKTGREQSNGAKQAAASRIIREVMGEDRKPLNRKESYASIWGKICGRTW